MSGDSFIRIGPDDDRREDPHLSRDSALADSSISIPSQAVTSGRSSRRLLRQHVRSSQPSGIQLRPVSCSA
jgi:hypothetical protein